MNTFAPVTPKPERLPSPLELEVMKVLWQQGEATVGQVQLELRRLRPFAYTTIMTLLDRLAKKGAVTRRKQGRGYIYAAALKRNAALNLALQRLVRDFFAGSQAQLVAHLRASSQDSPADRSSGSPLDSALL